jgi:hypothetical protein
VSKQPEALWLADLLDGDPNSKAQHIEAAAELRRLHAANTELSSALQNIALYTSQTHPDKEVMAQVLDENARIARAAIAKAERGSK